MNTNTREVRFGTKQEAIVTPKEGYELEKVIVINTADNSVIPSELQKTADNPAQWKCSFVQPAGHVTIKPVVRPILYSVTFEISDECNVVLVEQGSMADVEIREAVGHEEEPVAEQESSSEESGDFKQPQHSFETDNEGLNVGEDLPQAATDNEPVVDIEEASLDDKVENTAEEVQIVEPETSDTSDVQDEADDTNDISDKEDESHDVAYDAGEFSEELVEVEPVVITQVEYDKKVESFWQWKEEFDAGRCPEKKFMDIKKRHLEFIEKINSGEIVVQ